MFRAVEIEGEPYWDGGFAGNPSVLLGAPTPPMADFGNRIPSPLGPPPQAPVINGPLSQPAFRGLPQPF